METAKNLCEGLVNSSVAAEQAFQWAVSDEHAGHPQMHRNTWAAATIIQCDIHRYLVTLENSTREGLVRLLWMGDVAAALYEAKKWFYGTGSKSLLAIAEDVGYDVSDLQEQIKDLKRMYKLDGIDKYKWYRNKVGHHYDGNLIEHLRKFSESDSDDFNDALMAYVRYSNGWALLCKKVLEFKSCSTA